MIKRCFDILLSGTAVIILSPLLVPVAVILKLTGEHYIFYRQTRIGKDQREFGLLKFATMLKNSPNLGTGDITTRNDPRVLPFGHFLRKSKLNELPQLLNILKGDMSIIGPRPLTPRNFSWYTPEVKEIIGKMRPGLSGLGSIAFRDEESLMAQSGMDYAECYRQYVAPAKGELECWYYQHRSLGLDLKLIALTVLVVIRPRCDLQSFFSELPPSWPNGSFGSPEQTKTIR